MAYKDCTTEELIAYIKLEEETFDFGEGPMKMKGTEVFYYDREIEERLEAELNKLYANIGEIYVCESEMYYPGNQRKNKMKNRRLNKYKEKRHINKLSKVHWSLVYDGEFHSKRVYRGGRSKWLKKESNRAVRKAKNIVKGSDYRKVFDYWWILY